MLGALLGSFFNVCIYRIPRGLSLSFPGSHCYRCGQPVRWFDNIPLVSYWILRGHCRQCGAPFSMRYFAIELLTACLFLLCFVRLGYSPAFLSGLVFISLLIIASFTDIDHWIIPDRASLGGLVAGLMLAALLSALLWRAGAPAAERLLNHSPLTGEVFALPLAWRPLANALLGAAVGFASLWGVGALGAVIFRKEAMGWGDIKLFAMFGAFCGPMNLLYILILACLIGTLTGVGAMLAGKWAARRPIDPAVAPLAADGRPTASLLDPYPLSPAERQVVAQALGAPGAVGPVRHHLPFGPSLALAAVIVYLYGPEINQWFYTFVGMNAAMGGTDWTI